jgi:hypothetical protein
MRRPTPEKRFHPQEFERVRQKPDRALVSRAAVRLGRAASIPRARTVQALVSGPIKNRTFMQPPPSAQRSDLVLSPRYPKACRGLFQIREELYLRPSFDPEPQFPVATISFATSSLAPSWWLSRSSLLSSLSWPCGPLCDSYPVIAHAAHRHTQHCDNTTKAN